MTTHAAMNLPASNAGDVHVANAAARDVVTQGVDGDQVVELLGSRLERQLERIAGSLFWFVAVAAVQTAVLLFVAILVLGVLLSPHTVATGDLEILKNLISVRF